MIDGRHARDPVAVGVANDDGAAVAELPNHFGDIAREVVKRDVAERAGALADPSRLRPQDAQTMANQSVGDSVVVI